MPINIDNSTFLQPRSPLKKSSRAEVTECGERIELRELSEVTELRELAERGTVRSVSNLICLS